ncbi:MAG TPA: hypothetical protein VGH29_13385 [Candidatus Binataceae bacterium]
MKTPRPIAVALVSASVCLTLTGCFSYTKETSHSATPAVEVPVTPPATTSSTTTTTTTDGNDLQRQHTSVTTYP